MLDKLHSDICDLQLEIDCPLIEIFKSPDSERQKFSGSGIIYQDKEGVLNVKMYCNNSILEPQHAFWGMSIAQGQLIDDHHYYSLKAIDLDGDEWVAEKVLFHFSNSSAGFSLSNLDAGFMGTAKLAKIQRNKQLPFCQHASKLKLYYNVAIDFPCSNPTNITMGTAGEDVTISQTRNVAKFNSNELGFEIHKYEKYFSINASSSGRKIDSTLIRRVKEAIQFTLFRPLYCIIGEFTETEQMTTTIFSLPRPNSKTTIRPPLLQSLDNFSMFWGIFDRYLFYTLLDNTSYIHQITHYVYMVMDSSLASIDIKAMVLCSSIEGLIKSEFNFFDNLPADSIAYSSLKRDKNIESLLKNINAFVESEVGRGALTSRVKGCLSSMLKTSPSDVLSFLCKLGLIEKKLVSGWKRTRNNLNHGGRLDWSEAQDSMDEVSRVIVLFNVLVLISIGYFGEYTDYSELGYPRKHIELKFEPGAVA